MDEYIKREDVMSTLKKANIGGYITERLLEIPAADVQPINRWIKADESLPVYGGMVLICDKSKNIRLGIYTDMGWCSQFGNPIMCKITHWQSLPEPPKDGDTNG